MTKIRQLKLIDTHSQFSALIHCISLADLVLSSEKFVSERDKRIFAISQTMAFSLK